MTVIGKNSLIVGAGSNPGTFFVHGTPSQKSPHKAHGGSVRVVDSYAESKNVCCELGDFVGITDPEIPDSFVKCALRLIRFQMLYTPDDITMEGIKSLTKSQARIPIGYTGRNLEGEPFRILAACLKIQAFQDNENPSGERNVTDEQKRIMHTTVEQLIDRKIPPVESYQAPEEDPIQQYIDNALTKLDSSLGVCQTTDDLKILFSRKNTLLKVLRNVYARADRLKEEMTTPP